ncbi:MAG TPA: AMIN domain-containing protein [Terriglobales bacterium]
MVGLRDFLGMFFSRSGASAVFLLTCVAVVCAWTQTAPQPPAHSAAVVRSVKVIPESDGATVEILASQPISPSISKIQNPERLVIDLPNSVLSGIGKRVDFRSDQINGVRVSQFQNAPPVSRIVLDLAKQMNFTWDTSGNRLMVHTHAAVASADAIPSVPALTPGAQPLAVPVNNGSNGALVLAGSRIAPGSSVTAGSDTAVLRLGRGGEVRVCPGTTLSVTSSQNGRALMFGMSTGAFETHYALDTAADSILTPDFRIQMPGPGDFDYAISADSKGDTCVRALPGNSSSVIVSELLGDGTYQVKPSEQIVFHSGRLVNASGQIPVSCGCPPPATPVMRASTAPAVSQHPMPSAIDLGSTAQTAPDATSLSSTPARLATGPVTAPLPPSKPNDIHVEVEAPFVFRAGDPPPAAPAAPAVPLPVPAQQVAMLPVQSRPALSQTAALPEPLPPPRQHFFGRVRNFFAALFG